MLAGRLIIRNTADFRNFCDSDFRPFPHNQPKRLYFEDCVIDGPLSTDNNFEIHLQRDQRVVFNNVRFDNTIVDITGEGEICFNDCEFNGSVSVYVDPNHVSFSKCRFHLQRRSGYLVAAYDIRNRSVQFTDCRFTDFHKTCGTYELFTYNAITVARYERCSFASFDNLIFATSFVRAVEVVGCRFSSCNDIYRYYDADKNCSFKDSTFNRCIFVCIYDNDRKKHERFENCVFDNESKFVIQGMYANQPPRRVYRPSAYFRSREFLTNDRRIMRVI